MNCTRIEKLLPLYVEGDLDGRETVIVRAHLSSCDDCRSLEAEFRVSQQRLHNFAVPDFGAEFYEQIRGAVLLEINSRPTARPSIFQTLRPFFLWRPAAAAASLALLVLVGALSFGLYRSLIKGDARLMALENKRAEFNPDLFKESGGQPGSVSPMNPGKETRRSVSIAPRALAQRSIRTGNQVKVRPDASIPQSVDGALSTVAEIRQTGGAPENAAPTQAVARMEIQTSDPNIRIIWLGRKSE
jgi:hypothetical protein